MKKASEVTTKRGAKKGLRSGEPPHGAIDDLINPNFVVPGSVDDGFCISTFNEERHGWLRTQVKARENPAVMLAYQIIDLHEENNELRQRLYDMAKRADMWQKASGVFGKVEPLVPPMRDDDALELQ